MTDNEIIKALNYCCGNIGYNDEECNKDMCYQFALPESRDGDIRWCKQWLIKDALDLINRQKEEIKSLIAGQETLQNHITNLGAEIERLKKELNNLQPCKRNDGGVKMNKTQKYEEYKRYLRTLNLTSVEYEKRIREWCKKMRY